MKKVFSIALMTALLATAGWAQSYPGIDPDVPVDPVVPVTPPTPEDIDAMIEAAGFEDFGKSLNLQEGPESAVSQSTAGLFGSEADDYIDVVDWSNVEYEKLFFFLGGVASPRGGNVQGGFAMKLGSSHLGVYYGGNIAAGQGGNNGSTGSANQTGGYTRWDNSLAVLFGNEGIGGIRLDIMLNNVTFLDANIGNGDQKSSSGEGHLVTSLQWGKAFGDFIPKITLGFQWPSYLNTSGGSVKTENWNDAELGLKGEVKFRDFGADYQMTIDFGTTATADSVKSTTAGFFYNDLNVNYTFAFNAGEKVGLKLKPNVNLHLGLTDGKTSYDGKSIDGIEKGIFGITPSLKIGGFLQWKPTITIYSGLDVSILDLNLKWMTPPSSDTASMWSVTGVSASPHLGFQIKPAENFSIEMGVDGVFKPNEGSWGLNFSDLKGGLTLIFKPGAGSSASAQ